MKNPMLLLALLLLACTLALAAGVFLAIRTPLAPRLLLVELACGAASCWCFWKAPARS